MSHATNKSWGDTSRHYASHGTVEDKQSAAEKSIEAVEKRWAHLLEAAMPGARQQVEQAFRQWNSVLRDQVRSETALRLSVGNESQSVPVRVSDGLPRPFAETLLTFPNYEWLILNRPDIEATARGALLIAQNHESAAAMVREQGVVASGEGLGDTATTARLLLAELDRLEAIKRIADCREDVMGAYFFRVPEIRLFWVPIGIVARLLGVPIEALTVVVLTHELAHAYSHLGRDIDSESWRTSSFASADMHIVEGIAQFYTQVICEALQSRFPAARIAFEALIKNQSGPYTAYREWVTESERGGEVVRVAMIECRSRDIVSTEEFVDAIDRYRQQVKGRPGYARTDGSAPRSQQNSGTP